jgi:methanogenic corrinoid protein MtbC1
VKPARSVKNRRLYSEEDVQRLLLLKDAARWHHNIAQIAHLPSPELMELATTSRKDFKSPLPETNSVVFAEDYVAACMEAVRQFNSADLEKNLAHAFVELGASGLITKVIVPLMKEVGDSWAHGDVRVAEEHVVSVVIRNLLGGLVRQPNSQVAPRMIVATPSGQVHEFGALSIVIQASSLGWAVQYLGPNLPAEEIALAAARMCPKIVALSLIYKNDEGVVIQELQRLRFLLDKNVILIVGGPAARAYKPLLDQISAVYVEDILQLKAELEKSERNQA